MKGSFNLVKENYIYLKENSIKMINYVQPNLSMLLVHNFRMNENTFKLFNFRRCCKASCNVCGFACSDYFMKLNQTFYLPICCNSSCDSEGIIYIIKCLFCPNTYYIGQSGQSLKKRVGAHISNIRTFKAFYKMTNVSSHFNKFGHDYENCFSFYVFLKDCVDVKLRLCYEKQLIHIFKNLNLNLMNDEKDFNKYFECENFKNIINF
jgi:hypothetical protein